MCLIRPIRGFFRAGQSDWHRLPGRWLGLLRTDKQILSILKGELLSLLLFDTTSLFSVISSSQLTVLATPPVVSALDFLLFIKLCLAHNT